MPAIGDQQLQRRRALPAHLVPDSGFIDRAPLPGIGAEDEALNEAGSLQPCTDIVKNVVVKLDDRNG